MKIPVIALPNREKLMKWLRWGIVIVCILVTAATLILWRGQGVRPVRSAGEETSSVKAVMLRDALDEYGPLTSAQAIENWCTGVQRRNGALQYSVMSQRLKTSYAQGLDKNFPSWVTGVSSPWVSSWDIVHVDDLGDGIERAEVYFTLTDSTDSEQRYGAVLSLREESGGMVVDNIHADAELYSYLGLGE